MKKEYKTSKKECQLQITLLGNVCDRCGRNIVPLKTVDNSGLPTFWAGCYHGDDSKGAWGHFTTGVNKEVYILAYKLVLEDGLYLSMDKEKNSDFDYLFMNGVSKVCRVINSIEYLKVNRPRYTKTQLRKDYIKNYKT